MNLVTAWDVSSTRTGYAVVEEGRRVVEVGAWERDQKLTRGGNLLLFYKFVCEVMRNHVSVFVAIEQQPVLRGMLTTDLIAGYRNLVYMAYEGLCGIHVNEIQQTQRFKALGLKRVMKKAGERTAHQARKENKAMIMEGVRRFWNVKLEPHQEDEADALAIATVMYLNPGNTSRPLWTFSGKPGACFEMTARCG